MSLTSPPRSWTASWSWNSSPCRTSGFTCRMKPRSRRHSLKEWRILRLPGSSWPAFGMRGPAALPSLALGRPRRWKLLRMRMTRRSCSQRLVWMSSNPTFGSAITWTWHPRSGLATDFCLRSGRPWRRGPLRSKIFGRWSPWSIRRPLLPRNASLAPTSTCKMMTKMRTKKVGLTWPHTSVAWGSTSCAWPLLGRLPDRVLQDLLRIWALMPQTTSKFLGTFCWSIRPELRKRREVPHFSPGCWLWRDLMLRSVDNGHIDLPLRPPRPLGRSSRSSWSSVKLCGFLEQAVLVHRLCRNLWYLLVDQHLEEWFLRPPRRLWPSFVMVRPFVRPSSVASAPFRDASVTMDFIAVATSLREVVLVAALDMLARIARWRTGCEKGAGRRLRPRQGINCMMMTPRIQSNNSWMSCQNFPIWKWMRWQPLDRSCWTCSLGKTPH